MLSILEGNKYFVSLGAGKGTEGSQRRKEIGNASVTEHWKGIPVNWGHVRGKGDN